MTPQELEDIGTRLHGKQWKSVLANQLGRNRYTIHRWSQGSVIPATAQKRIRELLNEKEKAHASD